MSQDELDALIKKAGVSPRTAKKLHAANGTGTSADTSSETPQRHGGHGPSTPELAKLDF
jgi:hypothetical protein